ncbi:3' terminal RNA ribose 2'-O-methyltransferase Hen1 [Micromonospora sp. NPDC047134]|uniref:3' terminal RNA ribose 2'-O-methyltransferase Hen1 n=1 Tax=Micromonospora sp. NPDC047134 TaxID=3154340 RepID=UPI0033CEE088
MLLTLTTTHRPATDLGHLLVKHPGRTHAFDLPVGTAHVFYPQADDARCTAALLLEVDPTKLAAARGRGRGRQPTTTPADFTLGRYVNDRPYAASSLLASALSRVYRSALRGDSRERPELAATPIPLEVRVPVLRCRGGAEVAARLFTPLGWQVTGTPIALDEGHPQWGDSPYLDLTLTGTLRVAEALHHLYVMLPVLDDAKHYWVTPDEVDKLLRVGAGWLADHPERGLIVRRYLAHRRALAAHALERLAAQCPTDEPGGEEEATDQSTPRASLAAQRREAVHATLVEAGAQRVLDLGCGSGALLATLIGDRRFTEIIGTDVSTRALDLAARRLRLDRLPERQRNRVTLHQSALTYRDERLRGYDAAVLMEVVEHLDPPRLPALEDTVFGHARPTTVVVTTPNVEYNLRYEGLSAGGFRHGDHRFEWTRTEFAGWVDRVCTTYGYSAVVRGIGDADPGLGAPTQLAVFTRN